MVNHGIGTGGLFLIVGILYERYHTKDMAAYGGIWKLMPTFGSIALVVALSSAFAVQQVVQPCRICDQHKLVAGAGDICGCRKVQACSAWSRANDPRDSHVCISRHSFHDQRV